MSLQCICAPRLRKRQGHFDRGAAAECTLDGQSAAVRRGRAPRNSQSKPRSLRLRGVEGFEHPIERTLGYAASGVGDRDRRVSAERDADVYLAASLRSLDTVDQEIEKQLLERILIANYPDRCREIADGGIRLPLRDFARAPFRSFNQGVYGKGDTIARVRGGAYDRGSRCRQRVTAR